MANTAGRSTLASISTSIDVTPAEASGSSVLLFGDETCDQWPILQRIVARSGRWADAVLSEGKMVLCGAVDAEDRGSTHWTSYHVERHNAQGGKSRRKRQERNDCDDSGTEWINTYSEYLDSPSKFEDGSSAQHTKCAPSPVTEKGSWGFQGRQTRRAEPPKLIVGIDFGTTYSGVAYAWGAPEDQDLKTIKAWPRALSESLQPIASRLPMPKLPLPPSTLPRRDRAHVAEPHYGNHSLVCSCSKRFSHKPDLRRHLDDKHMDQEACSCGQTLSSASLLLLKRCEGMRCVRCWRNRLRLATKLSVAVLTPIPLWIMGNYAVEDDLDPDASSGGRLGRARSWVCCMFRENNDTMLQLSSPITASAIPNWIEHPSPMVLALCVITAAAALRGYGYLNRRDQYQKWFVLVAAISTPIVSLTVGMSLLDGSLCMLPWVLFTSLLLSDVAHCVLRFNRGARKIIFRPEEIAA